MDFEIVNLNKSHIDGIVKLEQTCFSSPWTREGIEEELSNPQAHFLAAESGEVLGYIGVQEIAGEAYITNIAVLPQYRRNGIAEALLNAAAGGAKERGCAFITLEVRVSNLPAIALYEKCGFEPAGRRKNFYANPAEDALIYTKFFEVQNENTCN